MGRPPTSFVAPLEALLLALLAAPVAAEPLADAAPPAAARRFELLPPGRIYAPYKADPHQPGFALIQTWYTDPNVAESGRARVGLKLGGHFGLVQYTPERAPDRPWQLGIEVGFYGQFDERHSLDNIGWDGIYRFLATHRLASGPTVKLGLQHVSSHVGDEYAERTGRRRIGYTRNELAAALSVPVAERWRTYVEAGWGTSRREGVQEPGRLQVGIEHEAPGALRGGRWGTYAALDVQAREERDWEPDYTLEVGLVAPTEERRWRVGVGFQQGGVPLGEFFQDEEELVFGGLWLDL